MTALTSTEYEAATNYPWEFDPKADFQRFLEEAKAKKSANSGNSIAFPVAKLKEAEETKKKKKKKCWRNFLFSWLRTSDKKIKMAVEPMDDATVPKFRRGIASGPVLSDAIGVMGKCRKPMSGPLTSLFPASKKEENGVPYLCLNQLNSPHDSHAYGPVYVVR